MAYVKHTWQTGDLFTAKQATALSQAIPSKPSDIGAATKAQGVLAQTAVQPSDLSKVAKSGKYGDLSGKPTIPTSAGDVNAVPVSRTVNGKPLSGNIILNAGDVNAATKAQGAKADTALQAGDLNGYAKSANVVPVSRSVNGKKLTDDIDLTAGDVGAYTKAQADNRYATTAQGSKADTAVQPSALELDTMALGGHPAFVARVFPPVGTKVMQSFGFDPNTYQWYVAQHADASNLYIFRFSMAGKIIDYAKLMGGGHGNSIEVEVADNGDVYIWNWWEEDTTGGSGTGPTRWKYSGSATGKEILRTDASVETLPNFWGTRAASFSLDKGTDTLGTWNGDGGTQDYLRQFKLSDYMQGTKTELHNFTAPYRPDDNAFAGIATCGDVVYLWRGGSNQIGTPTLYQYEWATGNLLNKVDLTKLGYGPDGTPFGDRNEAEGIFMWRDERGMPSLLLGHMSGYDIRRNCIFEITSANGSTLSSQASRRSDTYAPEWVPLDFTGSTFKARSGYVPAVSIDPWGFVHTQDWHFVNDTETDTSKAPVLAKVPEGFWPATEVRWMAFSTGHASDPYGGWIKPSTGEILLQMDSGNPQGKLPPAHFCIIPMTQWFGGQ